MTLPITRRRMIAVTAAALALGPRGVPAEPMRPVEWRGRALGADAALRLFHPDRAAARRLIARSVAELRRLEAVFSLYRPDSALVALNREGRLDRPPDALVALLRTALGFAEHSGGAFDPTVQPLWRLYAARAAAGGPSPAEISRALRLVDPGAVDLGRRAIRLGRAGMALTLNGIAQGYITDRIATLLGDAGMAPALIDLGEIRALGRHPDGRPWRIGLVDPFRPPRLREVLPLADGAMATSGSYGTRFDADGRTHHLFDPATGRPARGLASLTVIAPDATTADALSTALYVMDPPARGALMARHPGVRVVAIAPDGTRSERRFP